MAEWQPSRKQQAAFNGLKKRFPDYIGLNKLPDYVQIDEETGEPVCTVIDTSLVAVEDGKPTKEGFNTLIGYSYCLTCLATNQPHERKEELTITSEPEVARDMKELNEIEFTMRHQRACPYRHND